MLYYDHSRLTGDSFYELISFCEKKFIPATLLQVESGICYAYVAQFKKVIERSSGVKIVDADEFMRLGLEMESEYALQESNKAYHEAKLKKMIKDTSLEKESLKTSKNGTKWVKIGSYKKEATGERALFLEIFEERRGKDGLVRSEISGTVLIQNSYHPMWVSQFLHCVPKSIAEGYRLRKDNIFLASILEHRLQTEYPSKCKQDSKWNEFYERYDKLKSEYEKELKSLHGTHKR